MIKLFHWQPRPGAALTPAQERDVLSLVQSGREVEAVGQIRRWTNLPLQSAVALIADLRPPPSVLAGD